MRGVSILSSLRTTRESRMPAMLHLLQLMPVVAAVVAAVVWQESGREQCACRLSTGAATDGARCVLLL